MSNIPISEIKDEHGNKYLAYKVEINGRSVYVDKAIADLNGWDRTAILKEAQRNAHPKP